MDVTLPNGAVIEGIPEGTSKDEIRDKAISSGLATPEDFGLPSEEGGNSDAVYEPAKAIVSSLIGSSAAGVRGAGGLLFGESGEDATSAIQGIQQSAAEFGAPQTQAGQKSLETIGELMETGIDLARFPISGIAGLMSLITGQGVDSASQIVKEVQGSGVSETAGNLTMEKTGSPLMSTVAYMTPELAGVLIPGARIVKKKSAYQVALAEKLKEAQANPQISQALTVVGDQVASEGVNPNTIAALTEIKNSVPANVQPKIQSIINDIESGVSPESIAIDMKRISDDIGVSTGQRDLAEYILSGSGKAKKDPFAIKAIEQGFDDGVIASIKSATPEDRAIMARMAETMERVKKSLGFGLDNRPSDIAGENALKRFNHVMKVNKDAGSQLDAVARSLEGDIDFSAPVNNFIARLENDLDVKLDSNLNPVFEGSSIEGIAPATKIVTDIIKRMKTGGQPSPYDAHKLKKYIDEKVTYGKSGEGLSGKTVSVLKSLRRDIDSTLDSNFPEYNQVNTIYADTIKALDSLQDVAGRKMDLSGSNADSAVGTLLRRLMGNAQSRINLSDSLDNLNTVANKYGGNFTDDIKVQMLFADELDSVFGAVARTSLQGDVSSAVKTGLETVTGQNSGLGLLRSASKSLLNRKAKINDEEAFKAIKELLERSQ